PDHRAGSPRCPGADAYRGRTPSPCGGRPRPGRRSPGARRPDGATHHPPAPTTPGGTSPSYWARWPRCPTSRPPAAWDRRTRGSAVRPPVRCRTWGPPAPTPDASWSTSPLSFWGAYWRYDLPHRTPPGPQRRRLLPDLAGQVRGRRRRGLPARGEHRLRRRDGPPADGPLRGQRHLRLHRGAAPRLPEAVRRHRRRPDRIGDVLARQPAAPRDRGGHRLHEARDQAPGAPVRLLQGRGVQPPPRRRS